MYSWVTIPSVLKRVYLSIWLTARAGQSISWTPCGTITSCKWEREGGFGAQGTDAEKNGGDYISQHS